jgi:hypothetical protein
VFRLAGRLLLLRHTAGRLTNVGNQAESKPFISSIRGGENPDIGSMDSDGGRFEGATAVGRAVPERPPSIPKASPLQGERAMPMLFWLPMIFASALWEINGFAPRALADNEQLPPDARVNK